MSVVIETTLGDITVDLFLKKRPRASLNFLKLCKLKYYNFSLFHTISRGFIAQTGDPTGSRNGGESIYSLLEGPLKRYFESEKNPRIKHTHNGLLSFVGNEDGMIGSQFFITLGSDLTYLDEKHCVFGEVMEGLDVLELLNDTICDNDNRPYKDVRITHTVVLDDPFPDLKNMQPPSRSPSPSKERLQGGRIAADEEIDEAEGKSAQEISEMLAEREAKARATILEMVGDLPDADMAPPENVLFVCKLNPVTTDDDLEIIFSRFGKINTCEVIRDRKTGDSLQYAFVEFDDQKSCEDAYFKMDNVLIDDRRIHVDFSQSVSKIKWHGKGRGVTTYDDNGRKVKDFKNDIGKGRYKMSRNVKREDSIEKSKQDSSKRNGSYTRSRDKSYKSKSPKARTSLPKSRSRSHKSRSKSPKNRSRSPKSRAKSPKDRLRSPKNKPRSPLRSDNKSRSPKRRSKSTESPRNRSRLDSSRPANRSHYNTFRDKSYNFHASRGRSGYPKDDDRRRNNYDARRRNSYEDKRSNYDRMYRNNRRSPPRNRKPDYNQRRDDYPERNKNYNQKQYSSEQRRNYDQQRKQYSMQRDNTRPRRQLSESDNTKRKVLISSEDEKSKQKPSKSRKVSSDSSSEEESKKAKQNKSRKVSSSDSSSEDETPKKKRKKKKKRRSTSSSSLEVKSKKVKKNKKKKKHYSSSSE